MCINESQLFHLVVNQIESSVPKPEVEICYVELTENQCQWLTWFISKGASRENMRTLTLILGRKRQPIPLCGFSFFPNLA